VYKHRVSKENVFQTDLVFDVVNCH